MRPFVTEDAEIAARYERDAVVRGLLRNTEKKLPGEYSVDAMVRVSTVIDGHIFRLIDGRWGAFTLHGTMVPSLSVAVKTAFGARFTRGLDSAPQRSILVTMQSETLVIRDTVMYLN